MKNVQFFKRLCGLSLGNRIPLWGLLDMSLPDIQAKKCPTDELIDLPDRLTHCYDIFLHCLTILNINYLLAF